jgi:hypothetical protein
MNLPLILENLLSQIERVKNEPLPHISGTFTIIHAN